MSAPASPSTGGVWYLASAWVVLEEARSARASAGRDRRGQCCRSTTCSPSFHCERARDSRSARRGRVPPGVRRGLVEPPDARGTFDARLFSAVAASWSTEPRCLGALDDSLRVVDPAWSPSCARAMPDVLSASRRELVDLPSSSAMASASPRELEAALGVRDRGCPQPRSARERERRPRPTAGAVAGELERRGRVRAGASPSPVEEAAAEERCRFRRVLAMSPWARNAVACRFRAARGSSLAVAAKLAYAASELERGAPRVGSAS